MIRAAVTAATLAGVMFLAHAARAQNLELGWGLGLGTGIERAELSGTTALRRARTRFVVPLDLRTDEDLSQGIGFVGFAEVEPHIGLGGEVRYMRWFTPAVVGFVGATGVIAPHTLAGLDAGVQFHLPVGKRSSVFLEPSFAAIPLGTDLPDDRVLLWAILSAGIHVR